MHEVSINGTPNPSAKDQVNTRDQSEEQTVRQATGDRQSERGGFSVEF